MTAPNPPSEPVSASPTAAEMDAPAAPRRPLVTCKATASGVNWPCDATCSPNCGPDAPDDPRTFALYRTEDETGVSGCGIVAQGVVFADGTAVMRWVSEHKSTAVYASLDDLLVIHGHGGRTVVRWLPWHFEPPHPLTSDLRHAPGGSA